MVVSHQAAFVSSSPSLPPPFPSLPFPFLPFPSLPSCGCCLVCRDGCWVSGVLAGVGVGASGGGAVPGTIVPCFILNRVSCPWFSCRVPFLLCRFLRGLLLLSQSFSQWSSCSFPTVLLGLDIVHLARTKFYVVFCEHVPESLCC